MDGWIHIAVICLKFTAYRKFTSTCLSENTVYCYYYCAYIWGGNEKFTSNTRSFSQQEEETRRRSRWKRNSAFLLFLCPNCLIHQTTSDIMQRSILGQLLPEAMVCYLENHGADKFAQIYLGEYDTPEAIWNSEMRWGSFRALLLLH